MSFFRSVFGWKKKREIRSDPRKAPEELGPESVIRPISTESPAVDGRRRWGGGDVLVYR
jgi:hypothetical protein